jgi:hypothetical protein
MPESLLTILKFTLLAVLWLFFLRVLRAVWVELSPPRGQRVAAGGGRLVTSAPSPAVGVSAASGGRAMLLRVVEPAERKGHTYELSDEATVGRAAGCAVSLTEDTFVSQLHARLYRRDGKLWVEDLGSTNGTYLNTKRVSAPVAVRRGDRLQIGRTVLEVGR